MKKAEGFTPSFPPIPPKVQLHTPLRSSARTYREAELIFLAERGYAIGNLLTATCVAMLLLRAQRHFHICLVFWAGRKLPIFGVQNQKNEQMSLSSAKVCPWPRTSGCDRRSPRECLPGRIRGSGGSGGSRREDGSYVTQCIVTLSGGAPFAS